MLDIAKILAAVSLVGAVAALLVQVVRARGGGRPDFAEARGTPGRGVAYAFTVAMMPTHKESASRHPVEFSIGLLMHVGILVALVVLALVLVRPSAVAPFLGVARPVILLAAAAGIVLVIRRGISRSLRPMTVPDDFLAAAATCGLLVLASLAASGTGFTIAFLLYVAVLGLYVPLGKLRHAIFFYVARGDYGRRLGRRGVIPPRAAKDHTNAG